MASAIYPQFFLTATVTTPSYGIYRIADGKRYDFSTSTFVSTVPVTPSAALAVIYAGSYIYMATLNTTSLLAQFTDGPYLYELYSAGTPSPLAAPVAAYLISGLDLYSPSTATVTGSVTVGGYSPGQDPATLVLDTLASGHNTASTVGARINASGSASDPLANPVSTYTTAGSVGKLLGDNLNATVASRSTYSGGAVASVTAPVTVGTVSDKTGYSLSQVFPANFAALAISGGGAVTAGTVSDKAGYALATAPPTAAAIATTILTDVTAGDLGTAGSLGSVAKSLATMILSNSFTTGALANAPAGGSGGSTAGQIAAAVWQDAASGADFAVSGSIGARLATYAAAPTLSAIAGAILLNPTQPILADGAGRVTTTDGGGGGGSFPSTAPTGWITTAAFAAGATLPRVSVADTVTDKADYALSQQFPFNFAALGITAQGAVTTAGGGSGGFLQASGSVLSSPTPTRYGFSASGPNLTAAAGDYEGMWAVFQSGGLFGVRKLITRHTVSGPVHAFQFINGFHRDPVAEDVFDIG